MLGIKYCLFLCTLLAVGYSCMMEGGAENIKKGSKHPVCVTFSDKKRSVISPFVDTFTRFNYTVYDNADLRYQDDGNVYISLSIASGQKVVESTPRLYYRHAYYYPIATAIITVENGIVESITWDNDCYDCSDTCIQTSASRDELGTISYPPDNEHFTATSYACGLRDECGHTHNCNLAIFVVWSGTDIDGVPLTSAAQRFSRYEKTTLSSMYDSIYN